MGEQRSMSVQLDGKVADAWLGLNLMNRGVVLSYLQPIHPRCALGGTFIGTEDQSMFIGAARYEDARNFSVLMGQTVGDHDKLTLWNGMAYTLNFGRKISPDFSMITSGMFYPEQMNTRYSVGLKYAPSQDKSFKVSYNEDGKISSVMETPVKIGAFGFKLTIGSEINHFKNEYHSGISISIG
jgi:long-subunit fatty acid transport protein